MELTSFLHPNASIARAVGQILSIWGDNPRYNTSENPDELAMQADIAAVAEDFNAAIEATNVTYAHRGRPMMSNRAG